MEKPFGVLRLLKLSSSNCSLVPSSMEKPFGVLRLFNECLKVILFLPQWKNLSGYCDFCVQLSPWRFYRLPQWKNLSGYCDKIKKMIDVFIINFLNGKTFRGIATLGWWMKPFLLDLPQWKNLSGYCDSIIFMINPFLFYFLNGKTFRGIATVCLLSFNFCIVVLPQWKNLSGYCDR